ncbi:hypothetical protein I547_3539 [Mycobacterium kansasii 824]|nr:hypothetical protein I547_3539 [Mycobacterium kansasii 824]
MSCPAHTCAPSRSARLRVPRQPDRGIDEFARTGVDVVGADSSPNA